MRASTSHQRPRPPEPGRGDRPAPARRNPPPRSRLSRSIAVVLLLAAGVLAVVGLVLQRPASDLTADESILPGAAQTPEPDGWPAADQIPQTLPPAPPAPAATSSAPPVLRLSGPVPASGPGTFVYGATRGEVLGRSGTLRRYRVAVETGAGEDVEVFGAAVDLALGDPASWIASGRLRLQRVPDHAGHDFTIYLATAETARRMCAAGGVNVRVNGRPYTSCRASRKIIINLDRWRLSVDHFVAARVPLATYRTYVVNHEVGHELGHRHERCPGNGRDAPVMMQQTLFLNDCVANPWPYVDGRRYAGPRL
jgi:hypothetical protein